MIETSINGKPRIGLTDEQRQTLRERLLVEQEAQCEQARLAYEMSLAAVRCLRDELERGE